MIIGSFIKSIVKYAAYKTILWETILDYLRKRRLNSKIIVLMYHEIAEDNDDIEAWTVVKKSDFIRQMEYLSKYFNIISLQDALSQIHNLNGDNKPSAVVTFDDGYAGNNRALLPIIKSMNIPVAIFIATRHIQEQKLYWYDRLINGLQGEDAINLNQPSFGNYCINKYRGVENWREIQRLLSDLKELEPDNRENVVEDILKGLNHRPKRDFYSVAPLSIKEVKELSDCPHVTIGAHSHCHNILTQLNDAEIKESVSRSKRLLEDWTGKPIKYFSYPNGNYSNNIINILKESKFESSLTTVAKPWDSSESPFTIPRIGIGRYDSFDYFKVKVSGVL